LKNPWVTAYIAITSRDQQPRNFHAFGHGVVDPYFASAGLIVDLSLERADELTAPARDHDPSVFQFEAADGVSRADRQYQLLLTVVADVEDKPATRVLHRMTVGVGRGEDRR